MATIKYEYKVVEFKPNETSSEEKFTDALNAGATDNYQFVAMEEKSNKFYAVYQRVKNEIL